MYCTRSHPSPAASVVLYQHKLTQYRIEENAKKGFSYYLKQNIQTALIDSIVPLTKAGGSVPVQVDICAILKTNTLVVLLNY